ncbi:MAG: FAD-binding protein [Nitrospinae bacterium]|nr:FAD-binding protein [Nitrospinota bacterium]
MENLSCDVAILGGGPAAMTAAIAAMESGADALLVCKQSPGNSGNIVMARAGHSANFAPEDSAALFLEDTLEGGAHLNHPDVADAMCVDSAARIRDLYDWGIPFITREDGSFDLHPQGGHKRDRGVYPVRNWGVEVARPLRKKLDADGARILENVMAVDLLVEEGVCRGVIGFHTRSGAIYAIHAPATVLATGGAGQIYAENTNAGGITGDAFGMALRAGLALSDMEFVQFYPAVIKRPESNMVVAPTLFPLGARFLNRDGEDILRDVPGGGEATRDLMARAVYLELMGGGGVEGAVQMDLSGISMADLEHFAPDNLKLFARRGVSPHSSDIYVTPKAHFFMGGVPIDGAGATAMPGLYAAGEASAGAHGANRLSNNAFTEAHTLGWRAAKAAADYARRMNGAAINPALARRHADALTKRAGRLNRAVELTREIKRVCWENAGIVREGGLLEEARSELAGIERGLAACGGSEPARLVEAVEAENMCLSARAVVESALTRAESRGAHYRTDYPEADEANWRVNVFVKKNENDFSASTLPVGSISP